MNDALIMYKNISNIYSICAYNFPINIDEKVNESVLLPYFFSWGWGTWKQKWTAFDNNIKQKDLIKNSLLLKNRFNLADIKYSDMLDFQNNSWAIKWYYSIFIRNGLCVFPTHSLVNNIGFDNSGTNCKKENKIYLNELKNNPIVLHNELSINLEFYYKLNSHLTFFNKPFYMKIISRLLKIKYIMY